jgi:predicted nucleotidyltransferase
VAERNDEVKKIVTYFLDEVRKKYSIDRAYLYGSFAKGTSNKWSDIDIAIISPDFSDDLFEERLNLMQLAASIDDRIEPKPFKRELFVRNDPLVDEIQKNGIQFI